MGVNTFGFEISWSKPLETVPEKICLGWINRFLGIEDNWLYAED